MPVTVDISYDEDTDDYRWVVQGSDRIRFNKLTEIVSHIRSHGYDTNPAMGTAGFIELEQMRNREVMPREPDQNSIVIQFDGPARGYSIYTPEGADVSNDYVTRGHTIITVYETARLIKHHLVGNGYPDANVWPSKRSAAFAVLAGGQNVPYARKAGATFADFFDLIKQVETKFDTEDYIADLSTAITMLGRIRNVGKASAIDYLQRYFMGKKKVQLVVAFGTGARSELLLQEKHVVWVYSSNDKLGGKVAYTKEKANRESRACTHCGERFSGTLHKLHPDIGHKHEGNVCKQCASELGYFKCSFGCSYLHHEDAGCPSYHLHPKQQIFNYSRDVLSVIGKMQKTVTDKTINGEYLRYGVELEVQSRQTVPLEYAAHNAATALHNMAILKQDSSIGSGGFEIVTIPATLEYHRKTLWNDFFHKPLINGLTAAKSVRSWDTNVCGIHVHITRDALTEMQLAKLLVFYHEPANGKFLSRIAGRTVGPSAQYCQAMKKKLGIRTREQCGDHHGAIAVSSRNRGKTAEVRIFRGNATYHGVMRCLEFVDATVKWCATCHPDDATDYKKFVDWFNQPGVKSQYPELRKHLVHLEYLVKRVIKHEKFKHHEENVTEELRTA